MRELIVEGDLSPSAARVAEEAGIGLRTVELNRERIVVSSARPDAPAAGTTGGRPAAQKP